MLVRYGMSHLQEVLCVDDLIVINRTPLRSLKVEQLHHPNVKAEAALKDEPTDTG